MDAQQHITIPLRQVTHGLTVEVKVKGREIFAARFWVGLQLLRLARFAMGCDMEVDASLRNFKHADRRRSAI